MPDPAKTRKTEPRVVAVPEPVEEPTGEVAEAVAEAAEQVAANGATAAEHPPGSCPVAWCPICLAVTAVQPLNPQMIEHLLKAGTELLLAFRGVLDARADDLSSGDASHDGATRFEKIDLG